MDVTNIHPYFVHIAEIMYHEARHCEQWWHMARYVASNARSATYLAREANRPVLKRLNNSTFLSTESAAYISKSMYIPINIAYQALEHPMNGTDSIRGLT